MSKHCGNKYCDCSSYKEHLSGITFSIRGLPRGANVKAIDDTETSWDRDGSAYKALRKDGYQPASIDGSAELAARVTDPIEIEHNSIYGQHVNKARDVQAELDESNIIVRPGEQPLL